MGLSPNEKGSRRSFREGDRPAMLHLAPAHSITVSRSAYSWEERVTAKNKQTNTKNETTNKQKHKTNCFDSIYGSNFTTYIFFFSN